MHEHELWFTALLNQYLAGPANALIGLFGQHAHDHDKPWTNYNAMLVFVVLFLLVLPWIVRMGLSLARPGYLQQTFELLVTFIKGQAEEVIGHDGPKYANWFLTCFVFILFANLLGVIPTFESPTMNAAVPLGIAIATFIYYNAMGVKEQGAVGHLKHFMGPVWWLAPFMFAIEIISHLIRPVSLTIRLFANMLAGEQVTVSFSQLIPIGVPAALMGLHTFVSFLQAFIFTILTMAYVGMAVAHDEH
ncbi:F0F1 ATP synthase subunit A [Bryobacter aggregatus]|uniref:F0F1 ATP synthase subunit A n=1 Tax=Bryobacter aggregatus TaxID=360054 RepID=UPI0004E20E18|nr:F0F1 ATP synthase subunit A [Bryobacter aggregatus]